MALRSSSSSSTSTFGFTYDVFLNFRGSDTRYGFTGNLWKALCNRGINTFIDDEELQSGDEITPALAKAIEESRIAIPVFSTNYASSSFCLDELAYIVDCIKAKGRLVLPVFYDVDPSHVRHQIGSYGEALAKHEAKFTNNKEKLKDNMKRMQKWKMALNQTANLSGLHFKLRNEYEHEFIGKIVEVVSSKINRALLHVAHYPVGLESRVLKVMSLLEIGSDDGVHMVGIYGIGGMGKTMLARAVYNLIADQFEGLCFLHNVRENSTKYGLEYLQEKLLSKTVELNIKLGDIHEGIPIIKHRLHRKKILLVLDDVDKLEHLKVMVGEPNWFGTGSRVIITTREKHLLATHGVEKTYEVDELNKKEALELFRWNAFKNNKVDPSYKDILKRAVSYAYGLPLALEVIGSNLFGKGIEEWESALDRYDRIPNKEIQKILKVSFDALEEEEQIVFLDIACFFKGYRLIELEEILYAHHDSNMKHHIGVLVEKSLIQISELYRVILHDLIEDMGKEIVRQESPKMPEKRSRLWLAKDIVPILEENMGTPETEIIYMDFPLFDEEIEWDGEAFKRMKNLKTLIIKNCRFSKSPKYLPNGLRVLEWWGYPSNHFPPDFHPKRLSICKLPAGCYTSLELSGLLKGKFVNMKNLNLNDCKYLTKLPDVSGLPNLEKLSFEDCENLITIHNSVGYLHKLKILKARSCGKIRSFPPLKLVSLKELDLRHCCSLESFPEILGEMGNMDCLHLDGTSIKELPISFQKFTQLRVLAVDDWKVVQSATSIASEGKGSSMMFPYIKMLCIDRADLSDEILTIGLPWFTNLECLALDWGNFTIVPECIKECHLLRRLYLDYCERLREIKGIPPNLKFLRARWCNSLTSECRSMLLKQELHEARNTFFQVPSLTTGIPEWFEHQSRGKSTSFWFRNNFPHIVLCVVYPSTLTSTLENSEVSMIINGKKSRYIRVQDEFLCVDGGHTLLVRLQRERILGLDKAVLENEWNHVEIMTRDKISIDIGIHVLKEKSSMEDIQFTHPYIETKLDLSLPPLPGDDVNSELASTDSENHFNFESSLSWTDSDVDT